MVGNFSWEKLQLVEDAEASGSSAFDAQWEQACVAKDASWMRELLLEGGRAACEASVSDPFALAWSTNKECRAGSEASFVSLLSTKGFALPSVEDFHPFWLAARSGGVGADRRARLFEAWARIVLDGASQELRAHAAAFDFEYPQRPQSVFYFLEEASWGLQSMELAGRWGIGFDSGGLFKCIGAACAQIGIVCSLSGSPLQPCADARVLAAAAARWARAGAGPKGFGALGGAIFPLAAALEMAGCPFEAKEVWNGACRLLGSSGSDLDQYFSGSFSEGFWAVLDLSNRFAGLYRPGALSAGMALALMGGDGGALPELLSPKRALVEAQAASGGIQAAWIAMGMGWGPSDCLSRLPMDRLGVDLGWFAASWLANDAPLWIERALSLDGFDLDGLEAKGSNGFSAVEMALAASEADPTAHGRLLAALAKRQAKALAPAANGAIKKPRASL